MALSGIPLIPSAFICATWSSANSRGPTDFIESIASSANDLLGTLLYIPELNPISNSVPVASAAALAQSSIRFLA